MRNFKNLKRGLAFVLASAMMFSVVGCKDKVKKSDVTLKWYVPGDKQGDIDVVMKSANEIISEKIGAKLDLQFIDDGAFQQRMNMNMASGDTYDLSFVGYLNKFSDAARMGGLMELDKLLEETPALKKALPDFVWEQGKYDGETYAVPNYQVMGAQTALHIRKDLAQKYNLDVSKIKKTTDIEPFLIQIRDNEKDIYPFRTSWGVASFRDVAEKNTLNGQEPYDIAFDESKKKWCAVDGMDVGDTRNKAKLLNEWYKKGYIRKDVASVMDDATDLKAGKYAVSVSGYKPGSEAEFKANNGYDIVLAKVSSIYTRTDSATATMIGIGANCANPKEAIKLIELVNTNKELYNMLCFGLQDKHYKKISDNRIELIKDSGYKPSASWKFGNQFNAYLLPEQADDVWEETVKFNEESGKNVIGVSGFTFNKDKVKSNITNVQAVYDKYAVMDNGSVDPDTYWDEYKKKLYEAGLQTILDEYQKQLDEFQK